MKQRADDANMQLHSLEIRQAEAEIAAAADKGAYFVILNLTLSDYTKEYFYNKGFLVSLYSNDKTKIDWKFAINLGNICTLNNPVIAMPYGNFGPRKSSLYNERIHDVQ